MIDRIIEFSIERRWLVIAAGLLLALAGVYSVYHTPMDAIPNLSENQVIVFTDWMGHSPREIEDQVTYPLSVALEGLAGVRVVRSSSDFNFSTINLILEDSVDFYFARQQVSERLARAAQSLPAGVVPYLGPDGVATGQIFWYTVEGEGYDLGRLRAIQDWYVGRQIQSVPGVAEVASVGGYVIEYQCEIDPDRMQQAGLTPGMVVKAVAESNAAVGGHVVEKGHAEYIVRGVGWLGSKTGESGHQFDRRQALADLEEVLLLGAEGPVRLADVATVSLAPGPRRGALEKDGNEVTGGVVLMRYGHNPLEVTRRIKQKIDELEAGLPPGVRIVPVYDRTPLIEGAVATVTGTLLEAMITASICVVLMLLHARTSLVIAITLPLAALASFVIMTALRRLGVADIQTNIMSLAGIAISIGVLVDSSIVIAENVLHTLHKRFGDLPVRGDTRPIVAAACRTVGRPIFFSVMIMLISFLPVFALGGMEGKMFRPLAFTKSFAMLSVAVLAITLVPALCTVFIRGRVRSERDSWLVRSMIEVYRPVLGYLLERPAALAWILAVTLIVGFTPLGWQGLTLAALLVGMVAAGCVASTWRWRVLSMASLVLVALAAEQQMKPLGREFMTPLDEGMVMDMPITVPRASITQSVDDLKARDMVLCRFPEVAMVVGKAGRAETPTDPAPLDMIETMVEFRPRELWPKRKLDATDARRQAERVLDALVEEGLIQPPAGDARRALVDRAVEELMTRFNGAMREYAYQRNQELARQLGPKLVRETIRETTELLKRQGKLERRLTADELALLGRHAPAETAARLAGGPALADVRRVARHTGGELARLGWAGSSQDLFDYRPQGPALVAAAVGQVLGKPRATFFSRVHEAVVASHREAWRRHLEALNGELAHRAADTFARMAIEEFLERSEVKDPKLAVYLRKVETQRAKAATRPSSAHHHSRVAAPDVLPQPVLKRLQEDLAEQFRGKVLLWQSERWELADFGGELDQALQMPGWANVWTRPIQNRVDMLATGVNTAVGIRVLGTRLDDVVRASERIGEVVRQVPGAADVTVDPIRGKGYLEIRADRREASRLGVSVGEINETIEVALAGKVATWTVESGERHPVRVRYARRWREDEQSIRHMAVPARMPGEEVGEGHVPLSEVAGVRIVEGPATIKSENGLLRNYVRLNVQGRDSSDFVDEARRTVARDVSLPPGVHVEWTGQFEHEARARRTLALAWPAVIALILLVLYFTYHDLADALLMVLPVLGALAGGVFFQWLLGYNLSVTVWVGYIACFGMASATGIIMLVYLREALANAGGLERLSLTGLRQAVMDGAVQRLRPKLMTEATTIIGLAPMLWASGPGSEVIKPMAAPVLGGILIADEVIDLLLPVLFYWVRRWRWQRMHLAAPASPALPGRPVAVEDAGAPVDVAAAVGAEAGQAGDGLYNGSGADAAGEASAARRVSSP